MEKEFRITKIVIDVSEGPDKKLVVGNFFKVGMLHITEEGEDVVPPQPFSDKVSGDDEDIQAIFGEVAALHAKLEEMNDWHEEISTQKEAAEQKLAETLATSAKVVFQARKERDEAHKAKNEAEAKVEKLKGALT